MIASLVDLVRDLADIWRDDERKLQDAAMTNTLRFPVGRHEAPVSVPTWPELRRSDR